MTHLLLRASVHHLRITLEALPVGEICVNRFGKIESIDPWTEQFLGVDEDSLRGEAIDTLFPDCSIDFAQMVPLKHLGYVGRVDFQSRENVPVGAHVVAATSLQPHKYVFSLIYSTEP